MNKKEKIRSTIQNLAGFFEKDWTPEKIEKIVDMISHTSSSYIEKAVSRILKTESELGTNPVPQIEDKIRPNEQLMERVEIDPVTYDYE